MLTLPFDFEINRQRLNKDLRSPSVTICVYLRCTATLNIKQKYWSKTKIKIRCLLKSIMLLNTVISTKNTNKYTDSFEKVF